MLGTRRGGLNAQLLARSVEGPPEKTRDRIAAGQTRCGATSTPVCGEAVEGHKASVQRAVSETYASSTDEHSRRTRSCAWQGLAWRWQSVREFRRFCLAAEKEGVGVPLARLSLLVVYLEPGLGLLSSPSSQPTISFPVFLFHRTVRNFKR